MTYVEPSWITLLINGTLNSILWGVILLLVIGGVLYIFLHIGSQKIFGRPYNEVDLDDKRLVSGLVIFIMIGLLFIPATVGAGYTWNMWMEQPSVRTDTITVDGIQPRPGAVQMSDNGYYIDNSNQLMFVTSDGREFSNTENWMFSKFETRTIFNQLRVNGTYKIRYYGWRNGNNNEFPNILGIEEVINENGTTPNDFNKYFGANRGNRAYDIDMQQ